MDASTQTQEQDSDQSQNVQSNTAFEIIEVNTGTGEATIVVHKGILGAMANQLKNTSNRRKGASILRKLGYLLEDSGNILYETKSVEETEIDPEVVTDEVPTDEG